MDAGGDFCTETVCTSQQLGVFKTDPLSDHATVCFFRQTSVMDSNPGVILSEEEGCADIPVSSVVVLELDPLTMRLVPTELTLTDRVDGSTRTVTVLMRLTAREPTPAFRGTEPFSDGSGCLT